MIKALTPEDIRTFLKRMSTAIELDQIHVDTLPPERFSPVYNDGMWRAWRRDHRVFIDKLLLTAVAIPPAMLRELTRIAITREPELIGRVVLELFAEVVSGSCPLGGVDSKDSLLGANQIQGCYLGGSLGCEGPFGFERRDVGADGAADYRST